MRITELLQDATIDLGVKVNSKEEAIDHNGQGRKHHRSRRIQEGHFSKRS